MKAKLFGGKSKQETPPGYHSPIPGHRPSSPNLNYPHPAEPPQTIRESQPNLSRSPSQLRQQQPTQPLNRPPVDVATPNYQPPNLRPSDVGPQEQQQLQQQQQPQRNSAYLPQLSPLPPHEKEPKRGFRDRVFGHHGKPSVEQSQSSGSSRATGVGRTLSVKRKNPVNPENFYGQTQTDPRTGYQRANSSQQLLNTHEEEEESPHNAYNIPPQQQQQQQQLQQGPPVPAKEQPYEPTYSQQPQPPQAYYTDPRSLQRVNTDHSYHSPTNVELSSPSDQQYHPNQSETSLQQDQYTAFRPEDLVPPPLVPQLQSAEDAGRYQYQGQQQKRPLSQQIAQPAPTELHYQQTGRASLDRYRPQPELHHPQATRHHHQASNQDPSFLQPPRGSSLESPPSPLAPALLPAYGQQASGAPPAPPSPNPPSTADSQGSSQDSMPPSGAQSRNTARAVDKNAPSGSRESANPGQQGNTPGLQSFGSNVVPANAQGQPYRGQQRPDGELERATPPPQIAEMPDEEAAAYLQLQKEYKELRDKYQKVKKYYFEKESQVHQLQNTLAHQRLSQSRTSLDDSEYSARFSRLDGLISQLSFSIRKSWKTIPDFLHRAVNKDALVTGKQEMTAVGRAYFSNWLFQNVFDSFFHPDLEPGLSKDLKEVMVNIRRNCPPFQSGEEEEALTAKLINWRLATLEGLTERLRSPEAQQHHHRLVERLNEKLVSDISQLLMDPAPPDLNGGVQMILDLAVNIAVHVPLESRDVVIEYFPPYYPVLPEIMKVEVGIPPLTNAIIPTDISPSDSADRASLKSTDTKESAADNDSASKDDRDGKRSRGMFGGLMGGGASKVTKQPPGQQPSSGPPKSNPAAQSGRETPSQKEERVRLAVFFAVQIRGRSVLVKAPIYSTPV